MGLANSENRLLLSTANKSELALGYSTLYGDLCGALLPIGDLYKTEVYGLAHSYNRIKTIIPQSTLDRPPTAELAPRQLDSDSLPPYEVLDGLLYELIENQGTTVYPRESWNKILGSRHSVEEVLQRLHRAEFKRRQAAPVLRVHGRAFGQGWHMPIAKNLEHNL